MSSDFDEICLLFPEKFKLFCMRFKKTVTSGFLGKSEKPLMGYKLISSNYSFVDTIPADEAPERTFSLTEKYFRYCAYRRKKFFDSKLWPLIISIVASVITSLITTRLLWLSEFLWRICIWCVFDKSFQKILFRHRKFQTTPQICSS